MFAYQPAALGDILLAHKSFDVRRLPLGAEEAGAANVSSAGNTNSIGIGIGSDSDSGNDVVDLVSPSTS